MGKQRSQGLTSASITAVSAMATLSPRGPSSEPMAVEPACATSWRNTWSFVGVVGALVVVERGRPVREFDQAPLELDARQAGAEFASAA